MPEPESLPAPVLEHIAQSLKVPLKSLTATIGLLNEGGTVPFISRYRKEATGALDETRIRAIEEKLCYFRELEDRRRTVLATIEKQGKLTAALRAKIGSALDKTELEDLYLPYKPKRRTKASIAREKGLEPLARLLWDQNPASPLSRYSEEDLEGARYIVAEWISEDATFRKTVRRFMYDHGRVVSRMAKGAVDPEGKFKMYADYSEPVGRIPSHRMLAIRRGANEGILHFEIELDPEKPLTYLKNKVIRRPGDWAPHLERAVADSYERLLNPSIQTEVRAELKERADLEAIRVFRENLENVLLAPPAGMLNVLAIDPGIRTGCKIAVVDETGKFLESTVIHLSESHQKTLAGLIARHQVAAIAIGNGTGSREATAFVRDFLRQASLEKVFCVIVSEAGASVYSASELARAEFPDLDVTVRGAISIARRLQDPLAELVKIDPQSIGVGQYQHDVDQKKLSESLDSAVESCVNRVGVDLNTASHSLLRHVAGITAGAAQKIVAYRNEHGRFRSRLELTSVPGFGPKTFEQAAGFLRIRGGDNPLDMTAVHPESYRLVARMAESVGASVEDLIARPELLEKAPIEPSQYTLHDIREELRKPGRDPRQKFTAPEWRDDVREISDLTPGMILEGTVSNVTNFGAFVDVGVHQDGLVHVSELSSSYIRHPSEVVKAGQLVRVKVLSADPKARRIALSIKALEPARESRQPVQIQLASLAQRIREQ